MRIGGLRHRQTGRVAGLMTYSFLRLAAEALRGNTG
jgi:hypothetical protein